MKILYIAQKCLSHKIKLCMKINLSKDNRKFFVILDAKNKKKGEEGIS